MIGLFYNFVMRFVNILLFIFNGRIKIDGKKHLPENEKFVLVAPHHSILDPVFIAIAAYPHKFSFMAKKELFDIPVLSWIIKKLNAFPVDRKNPGVSSIRTPINYLRNNELNVLIFPTGSRYSDELKGGAVTIARLGKSKVVPAVYKGPLNFKDLFLRKKTHVIFGEPFEVERKIEGVEDINKYYSEKLQDQFDELSQ